MIEHVEIIYKKGANPVNEDEYVVNQEASLFAVIDGATGLNGLPGHLAATVIKHTFATAAKETPLLETVKTANKNLQNEILKITNASTIEQIPKSQRSSCGLVAAKIINGLSMEYVHAGDCMMFLQYDDSYIRAVTYDHLAKLDTVSIQAMTNEWRKLLKNDEVPNSWNPDAIQGALKNIREKIMPILISNRNMLNTQGGYCVLDGSKEAIQFLEHGMIQLHHVKQILFLSDGLVLPNKKASGQEIWEKTAKFAFDKGLDLLAQAVENDENEDPACFHYPRLKPADDKTGILIKLKER